MFNKIVNLKCINNIVNLFLIIFRLAEYVEHKKK